VSTNQGNPFASVKAKAVDEDVSVLLNDNHGVVSNGGMGRQAVGKSRRGVKREAGLLEAVLAAPFEAKIDGQASFVSGNLDSALGNQEVDISQADQLGERSSVSGIHVEPEAQHVRAVLLKTIVFRSRKLAQSRRTTSRVSAGNGETNHATTNQITSLSGIKGSAVMESEANRQCSNFGVC